MSMKRSRIARRPGKPSMVERGRTTELLAGVRATDHRILHRLQRDFERARRILVPNLTDWAQTGIILSRLGQRYGHEQVGRSRLTNDTLLAMSAARMGITILTANERDFSRIAEFRRFEWRVWRPGAEA
jgi:predicted nucleic acid-binding protein